MKQGVVITVFVLMFAVVCTPLAAQDSGVNYQTYMVETFDSPESSEIQETTPSILVAASEKRHS